VGVVVHPTRDIDEPLDAVRVWAANHEASVAQIRVEGREREVADPAKAGDCDLVVAIGGDGTALAAIHAAIPAGRPMLGVACGSLGALTTVPADRVSRALDRFSDEDWTPLPLPALQVTFDDGSELLALNDIAVVRSGGGQLRTTAHVDGTMFARFAGDGCIVSTPLGSSAYALSAGGPLLAFGSDAFLFTPLSVHGGFCPPLVLGGRSVLDVRFSAGHGGARNEVDGQVRDFRSESFRATLRPAVAQVVSFTDHEPFLSGLRQRQIIIDSPRILAEDANGS